MAAPPPPPPWRAVAYAAIAFAFVMAARYGFIAGNSTSGWLYLAAVAFNIVGAIVELRKWRTMRRLHRDARPSSQD